MCGQGPETSPLQTLSAKWSHCHLAFVCTVGWLGDTLWSTCYTLEAVQYISWCFKFIDLLMGEARHGKGKLLLAGSLAQMLWSQ